jgi:hypothetical protein
VPAFAISRYNDRGYETPSMKMTVQPRRFVRSHRKDMSDREGNRASRTRGMVSPTMTQKATMPPNALRYVNVDLFVCPKTRSAYKIHCATEIAINPDFPKQCSTVAWNEFAPLSFEFITMRRIVQSTVMVSPMRRTVPVTRPALRKA